VDLVMDGVKTILVHVGDFVQQLADFPLALDFAAEIAQDSHLQEDIPQNVLAILVEKLKEDHLEVIWPITP